MRSFFTKSGSPPSPSVAMTETENDEVHKLAFHAAEEGEKSGMHRTFILKRNPANRGPLRFAVFGCQGDGQKGAYAVGKGIDQYCKVNNQQLDFILLTGDNCYPNGMDKATDRFILSSFNEPFPNQSPNLKVPYYLLPGNHCENLQKESAKNVTRLRQLGRARAGTGVPRVLNMLAYTYVGLDDDKFQYRSLTNAYYNNFNERDQAAGGRHIDLAALTENKVYFNMPRRYYSLLIQESGALHDLEILMLDSNTFAKDCLAYFRSGNTLSTNENQVAWTLHRLKLAYDAKRKVILAQHHPLFVLGKPREDILYYMKADEKNELIELLHQKLPQTKAIEIKSQNSLLYFCMLALGIAFDRSSAAELVVDVLLTAHDHNFYYVNNKGNAPQSLPIPCQITAGTGGGELQDQYHFEPKAAIGTFLKKTGFVIMSHTKYANEFDFGFYSADDKYILYFDTSSAAPKHKDGSIYDSNALGEIKRISQLFFVIKCGIDQYLAFIAERQAQTNYKFFSSNSSHGTDGVVRANELLAYIHDARPRINYHNVTKDIIAFFARNVVTSILATDREHSLITLINNEMLLAYGQTLEEHFEKPNLMHPNYKGKVGLPQELDRPKTGLN